MSEWATHALADVLSFREGPGIMAADFRGEGVPLIRLAGLKKGASVLAGCDFLEPTMVERRWKQFQLLEGDVLLSTSASLGEVAVVNRAAAGAVPYTGIISFRPTDGRIAQNFIPWMLRDPMFAQQIQEMGAGSVMKHFGPSHLRLMRVRFPTLSGQRAIAEVLGALDDKIAANAQLVATSLELARALFRDSRRTGPNETTTYGAIAHIDGGGTPSTKDQTYWGGQVCWATPTDITGLQAPYLSGTARTITSDGLAACSSGLYEPGAILMTSRATIGAFAVNQVPTAVNQGFIVVRPYETRAKWWLLHEMESRVDEYIARANGATFLELPRGRFRDLEVKVPSPEIVDAFDAKASTIHQRAAAAAEESDRLASMRDTLLPRLMSGELKVKDAEKTVEDVM